MSENEIMEASMTQTKGIKCPNCDKNTAYLMEGKKLLSGVPVTAILRCTDCHKGIVVLKDTEVERYGSDLTARDTLCKKIKDKIDKIYNVSDKYNFLLVGIVFKNDVRFFKDGKSGLTHPQDSGADQLLTLYFNIMYSREHGKARPVICLIGSEQILKAEDCDNPDEFRKLDKAGLIIKEKVDIQRLDIQQISHMLACEDCAEGTRQDAEDNSYHCAWNFS